MKQQIMENHGDFLRCIGADLSMRIMSLLDDPADLIRASAVSRFWRQFVVSNKLAKQLCLKRFPELSNIIIDVQNASEATKRNNPMSVPDHHHVYASLLQGLTKTKISRNSIIAISISASSTYNFSRESVQDTLNPFDRYEYIQKASYWSSTGQSDPEVPETLIYRLKASLCVITEIDIQPFEAYFQPGNPIYSSKFVRFRMGHPKSPTGFRSDCGKLPLEEPADDKFVWTYTSQEFPMSQENCLQPFVLPKPVLCMGGYLQVELLGRVQRQETDGLYYICVCHVRVLGRTLSPAFDIEILEPHGKYLLKYCPDKLNALMKGTFKDQFAFAYEIDALLLMQQVNYGGELSFLQEQ